MPSRAARARRGRRSGARRYAGEAWTCRAGRRARAASAPASRASSSDGAPTSSALDLGQHGRAVGDGADRARRGTPSSRRSATAAIDERVVAGAQRELAERRSPSSGRAPARGSRRRARPARARSVVRDEEVAGGDLAPVASTTRAAERGEAERQLGGAVGVRDRAADGAAVARHDVADVRERLRASERSDARRRSSAAWRTVAPTRTAPFSRSIASSPARPMSTSTRRSHEPHVERRTRLCPPAIGFASSPPVCERGERLLERVARRRTRRRRASRLRIARIGEQRPHPRRRERQLDVVAAERVGDRVRDRRPARDIVLPSPSPFAPSAVNGDGDERGRSGAPGRPAPSARGSP